MKPGPVLTLALILTLTRAAESATWVVAGDGSGDFLDVQSAVDAASSGDLILVKPGSYEGFEVDKALRIVGSGVGKTVISQGSDGASVFLWNVPSGHSVIASLSCRFANPLTAGRSELADLTLWNIELESDADDAITTLSLQDLRYVWADRVSQIFNPQSRTTLWPAPAVRIRECDTVFLTQASYRASNYEIVDDNTGNAGVLVTGASTVFTSSVNAEGGAGAWGAGESKGGRGGAGLHLAYEFGLDGPPHAFVFGSASDVFAGGAGGRGTDDGGDRAPGGDGGPGLEADFGDLIHDGVTSIGGEGGEGEPDGNPGPSTKGNVSKRSALPTLTTAGDGKIGTLMEYTFRGPPGESLLVAYSNAALPLDVPATEGHPLIPSPLAGFRIARVGTIGPTGTLLIPFVLPNDAPPGETLYIQGIVTGHTHPPRLTNGCVTVITPIWN